MKPPAWPTRAWKRSIKANRVQQNVTDSQGTSYDMLNVHAFSETWLKKNLFFSTGYSYANLNDTFSGSRIYGDDYDVGYTPNPGNGLGYTSLNGGATSRRMWGT